jgi:Flp pilus assembly protein TadB
MLGNPIVVAVVLVGFVALLFVAPKVALVIGFTVSAVWAIREVRDDRRDR